MSKTAALVNNVNKVYCRGISQSYLRQRAVDISLCSVIFFVTHEPGFRHYILATKIFVSINKEKCVVPRNRQARERDSTQLHPMPSLEPKAYTSWTHTHHATPRWPLDWNLRGLCRSLAIWEVSSSRHRWLLPIFWGWNTPLVVSKCRHSSPQYDLRQVGIFHHCQNRQLPSVSGAKFERFCPPIWS